MIAVFTKIEGKLARFEVDTDDDEVAIKTVRDHVGIKHKPLILALIENTDKLRA